MKAMHEKIGKTGKNKGGKGQIFPAKDLGKTLGKKGSGKKV